MIVHHAPDLVDVVVVGAGAAGIAAARLASKSGRTVLVLEAKQRIGGRVHTDDSSQNFAVDLGAEFIHGNGANIHQLACEAGLHTIPVDRFSEMWWADERQQQRARSVKDHPEAAMIAQLWQDKHSLEHACLPTDVSLSEYLQSRGRTERQLAAADTLLAQTCCAPLASLSCQDLAHEMRVDAAGEGESRLEGGYGPLLCWMAQGLDVRLGCVVASIEQLPDGCIEVQAADKRSFRAQTCIVTVPVTVLQRRSITFSPALPKEKLQAADSMRMEPATKLMYHFSRPFWPASLTYLCHTGLTARWWTPGYGRPGADALICSYVTAARARVVDAMGDEEALAVGVEELALLLGCSMGEMRDALVQGRVVRWSREVHIWGGYAHCPVGAASARKLLAAPEWGQQLLFAGEATAFHSNPQTVHGAIDSGERAARQALSSFTLTSRM